MMMRKYIIYFVPLIEIVIGSLGKSYSIVLSFSLTFERFLMIVAQVKKFLLNHKINYTSILSGFETSALV